MKRFWPLLFLLVFIAVVFKPFFLEGKIPIPADTIVGLYHPWRDSFANDYPNGIPYKNFQITDSVRQQYPWRNLSLEVLKGKELPRWNPYSFSGTPLLANFQSAVFYPLNILFIFPDFPVVWGFLVVLQPLLGGVFMYFYLKSLKLHPAAAITGTLAWVGSGFFVAWLEWNTVVHVAIWLPLILLSIDKLISKNSIPWSAVFVFSLFASFTAGYLQPFLYVFGLSTIYLICRLIQSKDYKKVIPFLILGSIFLILSLPQLIPTLKFAGLSARDIDQANWNRPDWFLPWQNLSQFLAPDYFGNPATMNYFGIWNYQEFVGYIGITALSLAGVAIFFRRDKKTYFFVAVLFAVFLLALPTPIGKIPYQFGFPVLGTAQPSRIIMLACFSFAILSSLGLDFLFRQKFKLIYLLPVGLIAIVVGILWVVAPNQISTRNLYLPILVLGITFIIIFLSKFKTAILWLIPLLLLFDLTRFAIKFEPFSTKEYLYPPTKVTTFLEKESQKDLFRVVSLDDRIMPPNFNIMYKIQMPSGYDPLYLKQYGEFIVRIERGKDDTSLPWGFNRIITPKNYNSPLFKYLNVKYLLSLNDIKGLKLIMQEGETRVYKNPNYLPRTYLENGKAKVTNYRPNSVEIETESTASGKLVLLDVFYPSWKATIDEKPANIYITNYTFRGIDVPKGKHTVRFYIE